MKYIVYLILLLVHILFGCQSAPIVEAPAGYDSGLPQFQTVEAAIEFAVEESNLHDYRGVVFGSEYYAVTLPSGDVASNWDIDCYFRALFRPFGAGAFQALAPLLEHEHEFVQVGTYSVLNSTMHAHGLRRHQRQSESERSNTMHRLMAILESEAL